MSSARDTVTGNGSLAAQSSTSTAPPLLAMQGIVKRYGATTALAGVSLDVRAGEIHALLGENGAGKSTLMHVLSGLTRPDAGEIRLEGQAVRVDSPRAARALGIAMVHQHFTLVPAFTVAENLALDATVSPATRNFPSPPLSAQAPSRRLRVRGTGTGGEGRGYIAERAAAHALERARTLGWNLVPEAYVRDLSVGAQQRVEIIKTLATDARLLIFDEPTAVLAGDEVEELFGVLRRLRDEGNAVILIAHKLAEILAVADCVTVLRRGNVVANARVADTNAEELAVWMVGAPTQALPSRPPLPMLGEGKETSSPAPLLNKEREEYKGQSLPDKTERRAGLTASGLTVKGDRGEIALRDLSLEARSGDILGIGGVDGNGQTELAEALAGLRPLTGGELRWAGKAFRPGTSPRIGYIPQDRRRVGLAVTMSIEENLLFEAVREPEFRRGPFLRRRALRQLAADLIRQFDVRTSAATLPASALSGGNQQKIVVARALRAHPELIVAVNPTRGLDINATRFVHEQLRQARTRGAVIVLISTDLDELAALADRTAILSGGGLTELALEQADATQIGLLLGGLNRQQEGILPSSPALRASGASAVATSAGEEEK